ncbi:MAG: hypothetical protein KIT09_17035 [Bryobacteraceae bacterium]|nr:hypothetical protein [Bryobacteraceae bacterium]
MLGSRHASLLWAALAVAPALMANDVTVLVNTPMKPPVWALMEQELLRANSAACERFYDKYVDARGYLLHTPRWGTLDGPDDAVETFFNWTLLHALGGNDSLLDMWRKAYDGHLLQYSEIRTVKTELARNGAYFNEFITQSDWFHTAEGLRAFFLQGLSDPEDEKLVTRMKRFAGLYMNEDPEAPNYDPVHKIIKSIWNGSTGPMMRKATVYDWVGDPVPGRFHLLHNPAGRGKMLDLMTYYPKMLAHCTEYLDSVGDNSLNLAATLLHANAYMLTGERKYKDWLVEYVNAWKERTAATGGNIPSNIGLDGKPGGEYGGRWYKGTYGWNFTIFDGELEQIAHRNYFTAGSWPGFSNALLVTGDQSYVDVLRRQLDNIYAHKKEEGGKTLLPQMFGDPRGYKYSGREEWYHYTPNLFIDRLTEIYLWSMNRKDLDRIPKRGWIGFLEGEAPEYPITALEADFERLRRNVEQMRTDPTSPGTRLADYLLGFSPAETDALTNLMLGGYFANGRVWMLHSRFRYFDPDRRRAGPPESMGALVEKLADDSAAVTLVNTDAVNPINVIVQGGAYAEHQLLSASVNGKEQPVNQAYVAVRLEPGCGARVEFKMKRYANQPTLAFPWAR